MLSRSFRYFSTCTSDLRRVIVGCRSLTWTVLCLYALQLPKRSLLPWFLSKESHVKEIGSLPHQRWERWYDQALSHEQLNSITQGTLEEAVTVISPEETASIAAFMSLPFHCILLTLPLLHHQAPQPFYQKKKINMNNLVIFKTTKSGLKAKEVLYRYSIHNRVYSKLFLELLIMRGRCGVEGHNARTSWKISSLSLVI